MKKVIGYGYKLTNESIQKAFDCYYSIEQLQNTKKDIKEEIVQAKKSGEISKNSKPQIFKIIIEVE